MSILDPIDDLHDLEQPIHDIIAALGRIETFARDTIVEGAKAAHDVERFLVYQGAIQRVLENALSQVTWIGGDVSTIAGALLSDIEDGSTKSTDFMKKFHKGAMAVDGQLDALCAHVGIPRPDMPTEQNMANAIWHFGSVADRMLAKLPGFEHLETLVDKVLNQTFTLPHVATGFPNKVTGLGGMISYFMTEIAPLRHKLWSMAELATGGQSAHASQPDADAPSTGDKVNVWIAVGVTAALGILDVISGFIGTIKELLVTICGAAPMTITIGGGLAAGLEISAGANAVQLSNIVSFVLVIIANVLDLAITAIKAGLNDILALLNALHTQGVY